MDNKLIFRLKEFYTLETLQVAFYKAQVASATDEYYGRAFQKLVQIEQGHVDFFANKLEQAKIDPPTIVGSLFQLAGSIIGEAAESTGQHNTCKLGAALENKATELYQTFITESKTNNYSILQDTLMENLLDEEFHALWLRDYMNKHPG